MSDNDIDVTFSIEQDSNLDAVFQVNAAGTVWGAIDGSINDQTDLKDALDSKASNDRLDSIAGALDGEIEAINTTLQSYGDIVTHDTDEFATAAQGTLAETALQPNDNITELNNNAGYITGINSSDVTAALGYTPVNPSNLAAVATSGSYTDLNNKPTIGNGTTTFYRNSTAVGTISANQTSATTVTINVPTTATEVGALPSDTTINDLTTETQQAAINSGATAANISAIATNTSAISTINGKIPSQASTTNQLADKSFVNSSISTNTANFIGTFNSVADLEAYSGTLTNNDYAFVETTDTAGNTFYDRYKYTTATTPASWEFEYELNNSSFTSDQWAAINSGITTSGVSAIAANTSAIANKQDTLTPGANIQINGNTISATNTVYTLPTATTSSLGGVIVGNNLSINNGTLSADGTVASVNNISPDAGGNVTLTASDVGAITSTDLNNGLSTKVSKTGDTITGNIEIASGLLCLEGIGGSVSESTSRLVLGTPNNQFAYLTGNSTGAFGIYSGISGTRKGIACYPTQNFFADATTKTIDLGRSNNVWKTGFINTLSDGTNSKDVADIISGANVFMAQYGVTTSQEIQTALAANKIVMLIEDSAVFHLSTYNSSFFVFTCVNGVASSTITFNGSTWSKAIKSLEQTSNKVTTITASSTDAQYPSAKCVYNAISTAISDVPTHALKSYEDEGELLTDSEGLADVKYYAHSSFDLSKFTKVGSPTISDDGIASGFSSSNCIYSTNTFNFANYNTWEITFGVNVTNFTDTQTIFWIRGANNDNLNNNQCYINADKTLMWNLYSAPSGSLTGRLFSYTTTFKLTENTFYIIKFKFTGTDYKIGYSADGINYTWETAKTSTTKCGASGYIQLGLKYASNPAIYTTIDLKQFSTTVDGVEVFSGNKTGTDTIKPDNYTVVGSPTISNDGVASGFSTSKYLTKSLDLSNYTSLKIEFSDIYLPNETTSTNKAFFELQPTSSTSVFGLRLYKNATQNAELGMVYPNTSGGATVVNLSSGAGTATKFSGYVEIKNKVLTVVINNVTAGTYNLTDAQLAYIFTSTTLSLGSTTHLNSNQYLSQGTIDLNYFKISVDGDLVYQPCLKIPYTESVTGSKIADVAYRDRVCDMYSQFGYAPYYTLDEVNGNFTLPQGELYGFINKSIQNPTINYLYQAQFTIAAVNSYFTTGTASINNGGFTVSTNSITVPVGGMYLIMFVSDKYTNSTGTDSVDLQINGTTVYSVGSEGNYVIASGICYANLKEGDMVQIYGTGWKTYNTGGNITIQRIGG